MGLVHAGFTFLGTIGELEFGRWENPVQKSKVAGLDGVAVTAMGRGSREISCDCWIHNNFASAATLEAYMKTIDDRANVEGTLVRSGNINSTYANVRFDSMDVDHQAIPSSNLGWFAMVRLNFERLKP